MKRRFPYFLFILLILGIDQVTKFWIIRTVPFSFSKEVIPGFFNLTRIHNRGAIFGFLGQSQNPYVFYFLMLASLVALFLVIYYFFKTPPAEKMMILSLSLILSGALGNLVDRVFRGYVIDFLDFYVKKWHWPSFNVADASVSIGAVSLILLLIFKKKK